MVKGFQTFTSIQIYRHNFLSNKNFSFYKMYRVLLYYEFYMIDIILIILIIK